MNDSEVSTNANVPDPDECRALAKTSLEYNLTKQPKVACGHGPTPYF